VGCATVRAPAAGSALAAEAAPDRDTDVETSRDVVTGTVEARETEKDRVIEEPIRLPATLSARRLLPDGSGASSGRGKRAGWAYASGCGSGSGSSPGNGHGYGWGIGHGSRSGIAFGCDPLERGLGTGSAPGRGSLCGEGWGYDGFSYDPEDIIV